MQAKNNMEKQLIDELAELRRRNVELEQINNQFRQSEERFRLVSEAGGVGLFEWNATRDISYWSSQHYELTGFARGSSVNYEQWLSVVHPEDRERITEKVGVLLKQASTVQSPVIHKDEYRIIHPDKGLRWLESNFDTEMVQGEIIIRGTTRDISEHKEAQNILRRSEIYYRVLHENISDSFVQVDMNGNIIDFNDEYCQMLGYSPQEIRLLSYQELTPEPWHDMEAKIVREQIIPRGYSDIYEKEYRRKDGTIIPIELRTILIRNNQGDPESMWAIIRDISARKRLTESLKMRENRLSLALSAGKLATWDNNLQSGKTVWNDEHFHM
ncbi:MAG: PAS domain S-box protein, partial [Syntrophorhabdus sp.]